MDKSKLSDHIFKKGKFTTPWNYALGKISQSQSWSLNRLPEYLWLALILNKYGRKNGLEKLYFILTELHSISSDVKYPTFSNILNLSEKAQLEFFRYLVKIAGENILNPLTLIYTYSEYRAFSKVFTNPSISPEERQHTIVETMEKGFMHQSEFATDIRFLVVFFSILTGSIHMQKEQLNLVIEYPLLDHTHEKMRLIRPSIRSIEMLILDFETHNTIFLKEFWGRISKMCDCKLFTVKWPQNNHKSDKYMELLFEVFEYFTKCFISTNPLDKKSLVLIGLATFSYKRVLEIYEHDLYNSIVARSSVRTSIENYIMMKYLLKSEAVQSDIWTKYQMYGIALYKVIIARYRDVQAELPNSHVDYKYLEILVNEFMDEEYLDMDTSYFDKQNIRQKAIAVDEKELFGLYYDYDSSFEHGLWGAIRESSLLKCNSPAHQYHCVPDYENSVKLKSVWPDCVMIMNKTITILNDIYALPESLFSEVMQFEE